ncbi:S24 family peptidase [Burkholderia gladioli]|uniref:S24 family peptidase n=1 Tax=Burkholderia gladioli TaxID=28095 RepID=UPI001640DAAF|nr:S24 family peptidase [Burkholderia gladioli]URV26166.1 S24 family peptidase [Burkholderia gladioli]
MYEVTPETFRARLYATAHIDDSTLRKWLTETGIGVGTAQTILPRDANGRNSIPSAEKLAAISQATGRSIDWLLGIDDEARSAANEIRNAAGDDAPQFAYIKWLGAPSVALAIPRDLLKLLTDADSARLVAFRINGNAMAPTIADGAVVIVDTGVAPVIKAEVPQDGIYLMSWRESTADSERLFIVRRVQVDPVTDTLRLLCDNPAYPSTVVTEGNGFLSVPGEKYDVMTRVHRRLYGPVVAVLGAVR